ncbi:hypothetical protein DL770_008630 [Monosporascus sp. CRB-9-2]|nr:hypothetical protein DL770_008630 [Monosporascus sp. CRB-9-2]
MSTQQPYQSHGSPELPDQSLESDTDIVMVDRAEPPRCQGRPGSLNPPRKESGFGRSGSAPKGSLREVIDQHGKGQQRFGTGSGTTKILVDSASQSVSIEVGSPRTRSTSPKKGLMGRPTSPSTAIDNTLEAQADTGPSPNVSCQDLRTIYLGEKERWIKCESELKARIDELEALRSQAPSEEFQELQKMLEEERGSRKKAENELSQRNIELEDIRKRWKQAASELNKLRAQGQGFYQITDRYLIDLATQLRYNIRNFAIQYFGGDIRQKVKMEKTGYLKKYMQLTTPGSNGYEVYLHSPTKCPSIVQAFLWRILVGEIFDEFRWAGNASDHVWNLCSILRPKHQSKADPGSCPNPEAERKYQMWSATTTGLILDAVNMEEGSEVCKHREEHKSAVLERIRRVIDPVLRFYDDGYDQELLRILDDALTLDRELSRQVARVFWVFGGKETQIKFDSTTMELEKGEKPSEANQEVLLVVAPAMKKRGKSAGEDFKTENMLLQMEVSCEPV